MSRPAAAGEDPYALLGVPHDAGAEEVRSAFRRLALRHHPDVAGGSADRMAALNRAYALLANPETRRRYDESLPTTAVAPLAAPPSSDDAVWQADLDEHAADWRNMFEEERQLWEQLLASKRMDDPGRAGIEQALQRTRNEQLRLENALRVREGLAPIGAGELEAQRAHRERGAEVHVGPGCFAVLCLASTLFFWWRRSL